ncbi:MAG: TIGR02270 family protein, partial [Nitrospiria bacterium]
EAAFLWLLRDAAVRQPHYNLKDLAELDERVEAHIDGLRIAGEEGWVVCKETLAFEDCGEVFTGSVLAFESGDDARIQTVKEAVMAEPELSRGMISALGWLSYSQAEHQIQILLNDESTLMRRIGIAASAIHRQAPDLALKEALFDTDSFLRARACKAVGELARKALLPEVMANLNDENTTCRFYAAWTGLLLGEASAMSVLQDIVEQDGQYAEQALGMAVRRMRVNDAHAWHRRLAQRPEMRRLSIQALGMIGDPAAMDVLIEQMAVPEFARVAGESFSMITGVDIAYEDLEGEWPEGFEAGPTENPEDDNVAMDLDEDLSWPEPEKIKRWWRQNNHAFKNGMAYLCGKLKTIDGLNAVLRAGYQRQRAAAALELGIRESGIQLFETRAAGVRQVRLLKK